MTLLNFNTKYNKSITKILKDDNFIDEDYLTKRSAEQYNEDYDSGLLGQGPGNLDIGQTRVFTKPFDIYDFITKFFLIVNCILRYYQKHIRIMFECFLYQVNKN